MICYAIKNKEGKYLGVGQDYNHYWTSLGFAHFFRDLPGYNAKEEAEDFKNHKYPNCEVVEIEIEELRKGTLMKHKINVDKIHLFQISKKNKKYRKKIKNQAKTINGLLNFLESLGYDKKSWHYWEKNGKREYFNLALKNNEMLNTLAKSIIQEDELNNDSIKIPRYIPPILKTRRLGENNGTKTK